MGYSSIVTKTSRSDGTHRVEREVSQSERSWRSEDASEHYEKEVRMRVRVSKPAPAPEPRNAVARLTAPASESRNAIARLTAPPSYSPGRLVAAARHLALTANPTPVGLLWMAGGSVIPVLGNGDCGANCLALHLMDCNRFSSREELLGYAREVRRDVTEFYTNRAGLYLQQRQEAGMAAVFPESVEAYQRFMREDGRHFTMVEFYAASCVYGLQLVFVDERSNMISCIVGDDGLPQVFIQYLEEDAHSQNGHAGHFNLIRDAIVVAE